MVKIRKLKFGDILKVYNMYKNSSKRTKELFQPRILSNPFYFFGFFIFQKMTAFVTLNNKEIIGFIYITHLKKNVLGMMVKDNYQGQGIGKKLMEVILRNQKEVYLDVLENNKNAIKLYKNFGFKIIHKMINMKMKR